MIRGDKLCALNVLCMKKKGKGYYDQQRRNKHGVAINHNIREQERRW